jgi:predicted XRE-type DNA-binding protein
MSKHLQKALQALGALGHHYNAGEHNPRAKISTEDVAQIQAYHRQHGWSETRIAAHYGITQAEVSQILSGRRYAAK